MYYNENRPVPSANVAFHGPLDQMTETQSSGDYSVMGVPQGQWSIEPAKEGDFGSGISALDAAYVLQAVTGKRQLDAYQQLACDVSGNGSLSSLDAARILQFLVGMVDRLPVANTCASDWIFVPEAAQAANQQILPPLIGDGECRQGAIQFGALTGIADGQDFKAILFGDCTGNWTMSSGGARSAATAGAPQIIAGNLRRARGGKVVLPIYVRDASGFSAVEVALRFDANALTLTGASFARRGDSDVVVSHSSLRPGSGVVALASGEPLRSGIVLLAEFEARGPSRSRTLVTISGGTVDEKPAGVASRRSRP
jgi:hypothetical protein